MHYDLFVSVLDCHIKKCGYIILCLIRARVFNSLFSGKCRIKIRGCTLLLEEILTF